MELKFYQVKGMQFSSPSSKSQLEVTNSSQVLVSVVTTNAPTNPRHATGKVLDQVAVEEGLTKVQGRKCFQIV